MNSVRRILELLRFERKEITAIYLYAILNGIIQLSLPLGIQSIISFVMGGALSTSLVLLITLVVLGVFITGWMQVNQMKIIEKIQQQLFVRYSFLYAYTLPKLNLKSVDQYFLPELVNRFFDTVTLQKGLAKLLLDIPAATLQVFFGLILLSFYHPVFIFFGIALVGILLLLIQLTGNRGLESSLQESNFKYEVAGWLEEIGRVITSLKFTRNSQLHLRKIDEQVSGYLDARTRHFRILQFQYWSLIAFKVIITAAMLIVGSYLLIGQQLSIGQFIAAEIVILTVMNSVEKVIANLDKVYDVLTAVDKLSKITELPLEQQGVLHPSKASAQGMELQVKDLSFSYDTDSPVLEQISFQARPGEKIAVRGSWGSGKSTLLKVLTGSYQPYQGSITIDGLPLSNYNLEALRSQTGIVMSNQDIFDGSLLENITMGDEQISTTDILLLAEQVGLKSFIEEAPEGLHTVLHPTGKQLTRKLIQKILLLRALVIRPRLLLLDEPWLGMEETTRIRIQQLLLKEFKNTTLIIITSDDDFLKQCTRVLHLENGRLLD